MRDDMFKILVERPRRGGGWARRGRAPTELDSLPKFLGLKRQVRERGGYKQLNENLAPLRRYLEGQINRPWNKTYSEIRAHIKPGNTVQEHVLTHVDQFLKIDVVKVPATPLAPCGLVDRVGGWWPHRWAALREGDLYVDPDDGIIKRAKRRLRGPRPAKPRRPNHRAEPASPTQGWRLGPSEYAAPFEGIWFSMSLKPYEVLKIAQADPDGERLELAFKVDGHTFREWLDPLHGPVRPSDIVMLRALAKDYGENVLAGPKRQLSSRELKLHGLENADQDR